MQQFEILQNKFSKLLDDLRKTVDGQLVLAYATALKTIKEDMTKLFNKYSEDGVLSYGELQNYNRLSNIQQQIKDELKNPTLNVNKAILKAIDDTYTLGTFGSAFSVDMSTGLNNSWGLFNNKAVYESIVREKYLKEFLTDARAKQIISIKDKITQAILKGSTYKELVKVIESAMGEGLASAQRIAMTEMTACYGRAQSAAYEEAKQQGIDINEVWSSGGDSRVRHTHKEQDGKPRQPDGLFHMSSGATCSSPGNCSSASEAVNCRCRIVAELPEYGIQYKPTSTYEEWLKKYNRI